MEWLNLSASTLLRAGGWGMFALGLLVLLVLNWRGVIVGGAEHRRALERERYWRDLCEKQGDRLDRITDAVESTAESQRTVEAVVRALPRSPGRR